MNRDLFILVAVVGILGLSVGNWLPQFRNRDMTMRAQMWGAFLFLLGMAGLFVLGVRS